MKQVILSLTLIFAMSWAFAQPGTITNIQVEQGVGENERVVNIQFDLTGNDPSYDLTLEVSFDNGETFVAVDPTEITGETSVAPGTGLQLVWDGRISYPTQYAAMARIKIIATYSFICGDQITDIDGNIYNTVLIGTQCWMKENLKTTQYRNGTAIEHPGTNNTAWSNNTTGAYAWYNNDISWKDSYGALYNWHAVNNASGLCPTGWHVPSDADFTALTNHLGGASLAGGKMKSTRTVPDSHPRWESPNTGATNESNWSGLPGGLRTNYGYFNSIGAYGSCWSSTEYTTNLAWTRYLYYFNSYVYRLNLSKTNGFSVRCLRDN
jgi:uncharacterized protein (TIGR02145 family)